MALIDTEEGARRLARVILSDIELYSRERPQAGESLQQQLVEGSRHFGSRVAPELHGIFEQVLADRRAAGRTNVASASMPSAAEPTAASVGQAIGAGTGTTDILQDDAAATTPEVVAVDAAADPRTPTIVSMPPTSLGRPPRPSTTPSAAASAGRTLGPRIARQVGHTEGAVPFGGGSTLAPTLGGEPTTPAPATNEASFAGLSFGADAATGVVPAATENLAARSHLVGDGDQPTPGPTLAAAALEGRASARKSARARPPAIPADAFVAAPPAALSPPPPQAAPEMPVPVLTSPISIVKLVVLAAATIGAISLLIRFLP